MADYSLREVFKQFGKKIFGSCVNSCVSESQNLPLAASQGKVLQDQITQLNSNIGNMQTIVIPRGKKGWYKLFSYQVYDWNYMSMFMIISHNFAIDLVMSTVRTIMKDNVSLIDKTATFIKSLTNYGSTMNNISIVNDFGAIVEDNKITYYLLVNNIRTESYMTVYTSSESKSFKINPDVEYIGESLKLDVVPVLHLISN